MARGTTLANLRAMLNAELGNTAASNTTRDAMLNTLLSNKQKWLATEYDWPFLERRWNVSVAVNQQYAAFPTTEADFGITCALNMERMPRVQTLWNTKYQDVRYGIGEDEYNIMDFSLGQQSDPILRWRAATNPDEASNPNEFEVWPVPVTAQVMRFTGQRAVLPLASDSDTADLDDMLLVYFVAGEYLRRAKQADADIKMQEATRRLAWIRQNYPTRDNKYVLGEGGDNEWKKRHRLVGIKSIAVH